jgi:hypothetical protein
MKAADGVRKYFGEVEGMKVNGNFDTPIDLANALDKYGDQFLSIVSLEQELRNRRTELKQSRKAMRAALATAHRLAQARFTPTAVELTDFGFAPAKVPAPKTSEELAAISAKAMHTREILGTKGKRQKKAALAAAEKAEIEEAALAAAGLSPASESAAEPGSPAVER